MKFHGKVGFIQSVHKGHSVYAPEFVEKPYFGDVLKYNNRYETDQKVNEDIRIDNQISIVADFFAYKNFGCMRYVLWNDQKLKILSAQVDYPRIVITVGGPFNVEGSRKGSEIPAG